MSEAEQDHPPEDNIRIDFKKDIEPDVLRKTSTTLGFAALYIRNHQGF
jgi:hypothetical protein